MGGGCRNKSAYKNTFWKREMYLHIVFLACDCLSDADIHFAANASASTCGEVRPDRLYVQFVEMLSPSVCGCQFSVGGVQEG